MDYENLAVQLIVYSGNARSQAMSAITEAKNGDLTKAWDLIRQSEEAMTEAHNFQTEALQASLEHPEHGINMLMAHAQDHLMNALTIQALAREFLALYEKLDVSMNEERGEQS